MSDFAKNHTARLRLKYVAVGKPHVMTWRYNEPEGGPTTEVWAKIDEFFAALEPTLFTGFAFTGAEFANQNSDVFFPISVAALSPTPGGGAATKGDAPAFVSFTGKTLLGNPAVIYLYGVNANGDSANATTWDYRLYDTENTAVLNALTALTNPPTTLIGIDREQIIWNRYMNLGYNARAQRRARVVT